MPFLAWYFGGPADSLGRLITLSPGGEEFGATVPATIAPTADAMILIWLPGGVSQTDCWDPKKHTPYEKGMKGNQLLGTCPIIPTAADGIRGEICETRHPFGDVVRGTIGRQPPLPFFEFKSEGAAASLTGKGIGIALIDTMIWLRAPEHVDRIVAQLQAGDRATAIFVGLPTDRFVGKPLAPIDADVQEIVNMAAVAVVDAQELTGAARKRGLRTMHGVVLRDNRDMLDFVSALGFESAPSLEDQRLVRITKQL